MTCLASGVHLAPLTLLCGVTTVVGFLEAWADLAHLCSCQACQLQVSFLPQILLLLPLLDSAHVPLGGDLMVCNYVQKKKNAHIGIPLYDIYKIFTFLCTRTTDFMHLSIYLLGNVTIT